MTDPRGSEQFTDVEVHRRAEEHRAFRDVFTENVPYVCNVLRRLGVAERDIEDVAHELFMMVHARFRDFDRGRPIRPWLFGFAFRLAAAYRRLGRHRADLTEPERLHGSTTSADEYAKIESRQLVMRALDGLPIERRAVFIMHDIDGHDMPEIAAALSIPLNTAYSRLRVARAEFRSEVERVQQPEGGR